MDEDLARLDREALIAEIKRLRAGIREHRDSSGQAELRAVCDPRHLSLHVFPWTGAMTRAGLRRDAVYLVRPDGYVALADRAGSGKAITSYFDARALTPLSASPVR